MSAINYKSENVSVYRLWMGLSSPSKRLIAAGGVLLILMVGAVTFAILNMYAVALYDTHKNVNEVGIAIAEQTTRSIQEVDLTLEETRKDILRSGISTPEQFESKLHTEEMYKILRQQENALPQAGAFAVIGIDGKLISFSHGWPTPNLDLSNRDYYKYLSIHNDPASFISKPTKNGGNGTWTVFVAQRVTTPSGKFLGVLLGAIRLSYYAAFYRDLTAGNGLTIALLNRDGVSLASSPVIGRVGEQLIPKISSWYGIVASGRPGTVDVGGKTIRDERLVTAYPLSDYPFVVNIGVSKWETLADWRNETLLAIAGTACAVFCVLLVLRALTIQLRRLELSEASLAEQNADLITAEERLRFVAEHDDLTKLANRRAFQDQLEQAIKISNKKKSGVAILSLDLDRFKVVNDTRGHIIGDKLLTKVAARLRDRLPGASVVARIGGDEFGIIHQLNGSRNSCIDLARLALQSMAEPFEIEGVSSVINVSIGIACYPDHAKNAVDLQRSADIALYNAKAVSRGSFCMFSEKLGYEQRETFEIEQDLRQALERKEFALDYQPIVNTDTHKIVGSEVLLRWYHPQRGLISPNNFINLAENLRLIIPIGRWVLVTACAEAATWPKDIYIAVNLSPIQFSDDSLVDIIRDVLQITGLEPHRLILEVTEGLLLEQTGRVLDIMHGLKALGVRFNLDDFGTGHSGLGYLRQFSFDGIKIDKIFVRDMAEEIEARAIVSALLTVSVALNLDVIAEGVETEAQLVELRALGCKHVQGFLTGRPQKASEIRQRIGLENLVRQ